LNIDDVLAKKISVGVTGFSRAGKTVFIGSLTHALLTSDAWLTRRGQGPLAQFDPFEREQFRFAQIRDDLYPDLPQFPFRKVRDALIAKHPHWPEPTEGISRLVLDIEYRSKSKLRNTKRIQLEIVDYPGEWLMDFPMLNQTYSEWSERMLTLAQKGSRKQWSGVYFQELGEIKNQEEFDEEVAGRLSDTWTKYLQQAADNGYALNQPGRLLRPDAMRHSPILRLIPLPEELRRLSFGKKMEKRYEEYKKKVIKPFYRDHFAKMDRQIVLVDLLRSIQLGQEVFDEHIAALSETLQTFKYGKGGIVSWLGGSKTTHVLFSPTKADHVVRGDRVNLEQVVRRIIRLIDPNNELGKALHYDVISLASIRATQDRRTKKPPVREILYGIPEGETTADAYDPGGLPLDFPLDWSALQFEFYKFLPLPELMPDSLYEGFPSIHIGKVLNFLIGEDFK
jgi:predicted YcjX-like family ATPase